MKRNIFVILSCISTVLSVAALWLLVSDRMADHPDEYRLAVILAIPIFAIAAIICYVIQSVLKDREWKKFQDENPEEARAIQQQIHNKNSSEVRNYDLYRISILRGRIISVFGRIIAAVIITALGGGNILTWYIWVSYGWFFIKLTRNYIIGIAACLICVFIFADKITNLPEPWAQISAFALIAGIFIIDIISIIQYILLKNKIKKAGNTIRKLSREEKIAFRNAK